MYLDLDLSCVIILDFDKSDVDHESGGVAAIEEALIEKTSTEEAPINGTPTEEAPTISKPTPNYEEVTLDLLPSSEELASTMAIIDSVAVDNFDH